MAAHDEVLAAAGRLKSQLAAGVRQAFAGVAAMVSLVSQGDSTAGPVTIMGRPDVQALLDGAVAVAQQLTQALVTQAWTRAEGPGESAVLQALLTDVQQAYEAAPGAVRGSVSQAWHDAPVFERPAAMARAVRQEADKLVLRGKLSVDVAAGNGLTAATLAAGLRAQEQGYQVMKTWRSRKSAKTCRWCWELDGMIIPLEDEFPHGVPLQLPHQHTRHVRTAAGARRYRTPIGEPIIFTRPPGVYLGRLLGPLRHPHCECRLELSVVGGTAAETFGLDRRIFPPATLEDAPFPVPHVEPPAVHMRASDIAAIPDQQYRGMLAFLQAATHELGQLLRRLVRRG